jgi:hypothetical protein
MNQHERMAKAFAALNDDGRRFWLAIVEKEAKRVQEARRPVLRLIQGGPPAASTIKPRASVRTKSKEPA